MLNFERYMVGRYLRGPQGSEEGRRFPRFVVMVAVGGVAIGVASLLLSLSIVRGFSREIQNKIIGFGAHVQVESMQDEPLRNGPQLLRQLKSRPEVVHASTVVQDFVLLRRSSTDIDGVMLWGTDALPAYLAETLIAGRATFAPDSLNRPGLVIGGKLARQLKIEVGDLVTIFSMRGLGPDRTLDGQVHGGRPRIKQFVVRGIYQTFLENFDEVYIFSDVQTARNVLQYLPSDVTRIDLTLKNIEAAHTESVEIEDQLGFPVMARSIFEVWRGLFAWVDLQENIIPVVISVIVLVAAVNIIGALLMIVLEKTREIGVLQSLGAERRRLRRLFLFFGFMIGLVGTAIGEVLALALALIQKQFGIIPLPAEAYYMDRAPILLNPLDFLYVGIIALVLCVAAAYFPARVAANTDPIRVIRFS